MTGRCSDVIKLPNNQEIHPHFIETAAQNSCQKFLRGGCLAAFEMSSTTVLVAEIQKHEKDVKVLKQICEWARKAVLKEEKVEIGLMVLVKSESVPKTTSGKIQRWAAKDMLIGGKMSVVMEMQFEDNNARFLPSFEVIGKANKERGHGGDRTSNVPEDRDQEISQAFSSTPRHPPLLSLL